MIFGIPTYKRADAQITLRYLRENGVPKEQIIISTQTKDDYSTIKRRYGGDAEIVYRSASNLSGNRNTLLQSVVVGEHLLMLDDDLNGFLRNKNGKFVELEWNAFCEIAKRMFSLTESYNGRLWGVYPVRNTLYASREPIVRFNKPIICVHGVITTDMRYDETQTVKEDFMFVCENFKRGFPTLRLENVVAKAKHWTNAGGCKDQWGTNEECVERLLQKFPQYVKINTRRNGEVLLKSGLNIGLGDGKKELRLF